LADELEVTTRTIRNDIGRLRILGYAVQATPGVTGGYRLSPGTALPALLLDDDEAVAVAIGLHLATKGTVPGVADSSLQALTKLEQVLPVALRRKVDSIQKTGESAGSPAADTQLLITILTACRDHQRLRFDFKEGRKAATFHAVEPYQLMFWGRHGYLLAWDTDLGDWASFRVDLMVPRTPTGPRFVPRELPAQDVATYVPGRLA
jgi:predicted DNA-binding transcriptional regulator YafY